MTRLGTIVLAVAGVSAGQGRQTFTGIITDSECPAGNHSQMRMQHPDLLHEIHNFVADVIPKGHRKCLRAILSCMTDARCRIAERAWPRAACNST